MSDININPIQSIVNKHHPTLQLMHNHAIAHSHRISRQVYKYMCLDAAGKAETLHSSSGNNAFSIKKWHKNLSSLIVITTCLNVKGLE